MKKIVISLLLLSGILLPSCSNKSKTKIDGNIDTFLLEKDNYYVEGNVEEISAKIANSSSFLVYFTSDGCGACKRFSPIMDSYMKDVNFLTYRFVVDSQIEEVRKFAEMWGDKFFNERQEIYTPSLYVVDCEFNVNQINYDSYMKTETAFKNHMNANYEQSNVYFTSGDVSSSNKDFVYIHYDFSDSNLKSLYDSKLKRFIRTSNKSIVVSDFNNDGKLHLSSSNEDLVINNDTGEEEISKFF